MSFLSTEQSVDKGTPIELYKFTVGSVIYRYTSSELAAEGPDTVDAGTMYQPLPLSRSRDGEDQTFDTTTMNVRMPRTAPIALVYAGNPPSVVVTLTVYQRHWEDPVSGYRSVWNGRVISPSWEDSAVVLGCEPILASMKGVGLRRKYQKACPHVLYGAGLGECNVNQASFESSIATFFVSGNSLTAASLAAFAANYFAGGFITYTNTVTGIQELRAIRSSLAGVLELSYAPDGIAGATNLKAYPGCNHTSAMCISKFNNLVNYGGQLYIPSVNPFGGAILY